MTVNPKHRIGQGLIALLLCLLATVPRLTAQNCPVLSNTLAIGIGTCQEDCTNGLDDDLDGFTDCLDQDCAVGEFFLLADGPTTFCEPGSVQLRVYKPMSFNALWSTGGTADSILATNSGTYTVTLTNGAGCTRSTSRSVAALAPPAANAYVTGLSCAGGQVSVEASGGKYFAWQGPNGFTSHLNTLIFNHLETARTGNYTVTVTDNNGCTGTASTPLTIGLPPAGFEVSGGRITCDNPSVTLQISGNLTGYTVQNSAPPISTPGVYSVSIEEMSTGCVFQDTAEVFQVDSAFTLNCSVLNPLTCLRDTAEVNIFTTVHDMACEWTGPNAFNSNAERPPLTMPGTYHLTVKNNPTGCEQTCALTVTENRTAPTGAASSENLTCSKTQVQLLGTSPTPGVQYFWTGPGGFASTLQNPVASQPGTYFLKIVDAVNGCGSVILQTTVTVQ